MTINLFYSFQKNEKQFCFFYLYVYERKALRYLKFLMDLFILANGICKK